MGAVPADLQAVESPGLCGGRIQVSTGYSAAVLALPWMLDMLIGPLRQQIEQQG